LELQVQVEGPPGGACGGNHQQLESGVLRLTAVNTDSPKSSSQVPKKTACSDLPSGPQHLWGAGKHVVKSDLA
jgi:hypothetical protein